MSESPHHEHANARNKRLVIAWLVILIGTPSVLVTLPPHKINWLGLVIFYIMFTVLIGVLRLVHYDTADKLDQKNNSPLSES